MTESMNSGILQTILSVLAAALLTSAIFRRFNLPTVLGFLVVGALMGPNGLNLIPNAEATKEIAEFGIVFLMFMVGLEFSQAKLFALKKSVFVVGGLQVILSIAIFTTLSMLFGLQTLPALIVSGVIAMSSTALVVKQLEERYELNTPYGLNTVGILLFQDLAVIPFIILIAGMATPGPYTLTGLFIWAGAKGVIAIFLILSMGRWLLRPIFHTIAKTQTVELFTFTVLLITLTSAWLTNLFGLSFSLGAFLAGMMLAETEFRHQIEIEIRPFRDILLALFFVTIGMLADFKHWGELWQSILLVLAALVIGKGILIAMISRLAGFNNIVSVRTAILLAQGGEFGFAILTLALSHNLLSPAESQVILAALLLSIAIAPLLIHFNHKIAHALLPFSLRKHTLQLQEDISAKSKTLDKHVIICGFGRVGQQIARILAKTSVGYIALDTDAELVRLRDQAGEKVIYGDASHPAILTAAGIDRAKAVVISIGNFKPSQRILSLIRQSHPNIPIIVRCKDDVEMLKLKKHRPTKIVSQTFEESLTLIHYLLKTFNIPTKEISKILEDSRDKEYEILRHMLPQMYGEILHVESSIHENILPVTLHNHAFAIGKPLNTFNFEALGVEVIAIRRGRKKPLKPHAHFIFKAHDSMVLYGRLAAIRKAETMLLQGK